MAYNLLYPTLITNQKPQHSTRRLIMLGFLIALILLIAAIFFFIKATFVVAAILLLGAIVAALFGPLSKRRSSV
jgi:hypothetical protein